MSLSLHRCLLLDVDRKSEKQGQRETDRQTEKRDTQKEKGIQKKCQMRDSKSQAYKGTRNRKLDRHRTRDRQRRIWNGHRRK